MVINCKKRRCQLLLYIGDFHKINPKLPHDFLPSPTSKSAIMLGVNLENLKIFKGILSRGTLLRNIEDVRLEVPKNVEIVVVGALSVSHGGIIKHLVKTNSTQIIIMLHNTT